MLRFSDDDCTVVFEDGMVWHIEARGSDAGLEYEQILLSPKETPRSNPRKLSRLQAVGKPNPYQSATAKVLYLLCILLVTLVPLLHASHVHPGNSKPGNHGCSICGMAHDGFVVKGVFQPIPRSAPSIFVGCGEEAPKSFLVISSIYIRPP